MTKKKLAEVLVVDAEFSFLFEFVPLRYQHKYGYILKTVAMYLINEWFVHKMSG